MSLRVSARRLSVVAIILGAALLALALFVDVLRGLPLSSFGPGQLALASLGILIAGGGLALLRRPALADRLLPAARRLAAGFQTLSYLVAGALAVFLVLEVAAAILADRSAPAVHRAKLWRQVPEYAAREWAERHIDEYFQLERGYRRYLIWRTRPFEGETIRVDAEGVRRTPGASADPSALEVFAFGGSAMWGLGVPDWLTLPAHLQQGLEGTSEAPVRVVNLAENGYVSTQDLLRLNLELQVGRVPDVAVFYDGFNDIGVTTGGDAGSHYSEARISGRLHHPLRTWFLTSRTINLPRQLLRLRPSFEHMADETRRRRLADEIVAVYLGNYRLVDALSEAYGFSYLFFWQPALVASGKERTSIEDLFYADAAPEWIALCREVYRRIAEEAAVRENLVSLAGAFDRETASVFIDEVHVTPRGNEILAAEMLEALVPRLAAPPQR